MSSQVPVWVPLVVALLGVAGVVAAQFVNAWREERRWRRELQREDVRWQRTKAIENAKLRLDHAGQWREQKAKTYGDLIRLLREVQTSIDTYFNRQPPADEPDEEWSTLERQLAEKVDASIVELERVAAEAIVIAPPAIGHILENVSNIALGFIADRLKVILEGIAEGVPSSPSRVRKIRDAILPLVQDDLGVNPSKIDEDTAEP